MDSGNLAWYVTATALVLFMTPGVAFFYGGLVKAKSVVSMMMMSFGSIGLVGVLWVLYGFNMGTTTAGEGNLIPGIVGNPFSDIALIGKAEGAVGTIGDGLTEVAFTATFAIITTALISGAIADRAKFGAWMLFAGVWATLVYFPVAGWVWGYDAEGNLTGWIGGWGALDYAGGTAVHINAGAAALALALVLGKRVGFAKGIQKPHNVPLVLLGAAILWFGWFGFNGGAAAWFGMDGLGLITLNTLVCTAAAVIGWIVVEKLKDGKATSVGAASGAVTGLVAITPACAFISPLWAIVLGLVAGAICALAVELKWKLGYDDSLDVVGIHMVGGLIGTLYLGFFATGSGLIFSGSFDQLVIQAGSAFGVMIYSFVVAYVIGFAIEKTIGFRVKNEDELAGVDTVVHGEEGYALAEK